MTEIQKKQNISQTYEQENKKGYVNPMLRERNIKSDNFLSYLYIVFYIYFFSNKKQIKLSNIK